MLTCSSCCVTVTFTRSSPTRGHLTNFCRPTNFYEFLILFFNFGKFVKIREFFAEVTNSRSMRRVIIFLCHIRSNTAGLLLRWLREIDVFSANFDSLVLTMYKTLPTNWLTYVQNILQPSFVAPSKANDSYLPPYSILSTNNAAFATVVITLSATSPSGE